MAFHNVPPNGFPDLPDVEELEAVEKDVKTLKTTTSEHGAAITALGTSKAAKADIAPTFSAESNYAVGDLVYYEGALYECTTEHEAAAWDAENFTAASIDDELSSLKSGLTNVQHSFIKRTFVLSAQYAEPYYLFEWNIALDGWYPLAVAGFGGSVVSVNISNVTVSGSENKLYCDVYNITGNNIPSSYKVTVDVLYTKLIMI